MFFPSLVVRCTRLPSYRIRSSCKFRWAFKLLTEPCNKTGKPCDATKYDIIKRVSSSLEAIEKFYKGRKWNSVNSPYKGDSNPYHGWKVRSSSHKRFAVRIATNYSFLYLSFVLHSLTSSLHLRLITFRK